MNGFPPPGRMLEITSQRTPSLDQYHRQSFGLSRPLTELSDEAPQVARHDYRDLHSSFSNDETAQYFLQLIGRTKTPEFRLATNRTAILVGESALANALTLGGLPEDTIIIFDNEPAAITFMSDYIAALKEEPTLAGWNNRMGLDKLEKRYPQLHLRLVSQAYEWAVNGFQTPLFDEDAYHGAHLEARRKAIIPWLGGRPAEPDVSCLARGRKGHGGTSTRMILTNAMVVGRPRMKTAAEYAQLLSFLPTTPLAPILVSSITKKYPAGNSPESLISAGIYESVGPFFGIENLRDHGGKLISTELGGEAAKRRYAHEQRTPETNMEQLSKLMNDMKDRPQLRGPVLPKTPNGKAPRPSKRYTPPKNKR